MRRHLLLVLVLGLCVEAGAAELEARAATDTSDYRVGDWIAVRVELRHPAGTTFQMLFGDSLGPYVVLDRQAFEPVDSTETRTALVVARYDSGTVALPPLEFLASVPGDTAVRRVSTTPLPLTVHTLPVSAQDSLRALKEPLSIPYTLAEVLGALGVLAALVAGGYILYRWYRRRKKAPVEPVAQGPAKPPHLIALEELGAVKARRLWQQGHAKEYHSEVTEVLRRYFEHRFGVRALEETTEEILSGSARRRPPGECSGECRQHPAPGGSCEVCDLSAAAGGARGEHERVGVRRPGDAAHGSRSHSAQHFRRLLRMWGPDAVFANPGFLYGLLALPLLAVWYIRRHRRMASRLRYSTLLPFEAAKPTIRERLRHVPFLLRCLALVFLIVALARPQTVSEGQTIYTEGIDIVLLLDISGSMLAEDFQPNRIDAAKAVAESFVNGQTERPHRIGGLCRPEFHAVSHDAGLRCPEEPPPGSPAGDGGGWDGDRDGDCSGGEPRQG